jgi:hypothetical protein
MWHETVIDWLKRWTGPGAGAAQSDAGAKARNVE